MLLRRVIEHVKDQNWTAVALDFLIVVVGVFIGIQVSNWNAARRDRADEQAFLQQLHADVVRVETVTNRLRERIIANIGQMNDAMDLITAGAEDAELTPEVCLTLAYSHDFVISTSHLPSLRELTNSGRLGILRDEKLRRSLTEFEQARDTLDYWLDEGVRNLHDLADKYPDAFRYTAYFDDERDEIWAHGECDLDRIRSNKRLISNLSLNVDTADALARDALLPWTNQLYELHEQLDDILAVEHEGDD